MSSCGDNSNGICPHTLGYHSDVSANNPADGQVLTYNDTLQMWVPGNPGGNLSLDDLTDVDALPVNIGECLCWDGTSWVPTDLNIPQVLSDLGDADTTGAASGNLLGYNGTDWVPVAASTGGVVNLDDLGDVDAPTPLLDECLCWNGTAWVPVDILSLATGGGNLALDDLTDVDAGTPADGECLCWVAANNAWEASALAAHPLNFHSDVTAPAPTTGQVLTWNGAAWVPSTASTNSVTGSKVISGTVLENTIVAGTDFTTALVGATIVITPTTPFGAACIFTYSESATNTITTEVQGPATFNIPTIGGLTHVFNIVGPA